MLVVEANMKGPSEVGVHPVCHHSWNLEADFAFVVTVVLGRVWHKTKWW